MPHTELDLKDFLKRRDSYRLGKLLTESPHPKTKKLSYLAMENLPKAYQVFKSIDREALQVLKGQERLLSSLSSELQAVLDLGTRVFLCGCGATGRLALTLERCWREAAKEKDFKYRADQLQAFMAGGDVALVKSIESFEDREDFGAKQLRDLRPSKDDLLLAITEGGETPFVIGACEEFLKHSNHSPYFLYANPDKILKEVAPRSRRVLENSQIKKISLAHCAQALSGSTRLQASTVLMMAIAQGLSCALSGRKIQNTLFDLMMKQLSCIDMTKLCELTFFEQDCFEKDKCVYYTGEAKHLISIFTDTTERSPTFGCTPFEHDNERSKNFCSSNYVFLETSDAQAAWRHILGREPRPISWPEVAGIADQDRLQGYDFSRAVIEKRKPYFSSHEVIRVLKKQDKLSFAFHQREVSFALLSTGQKFYDLLLEQFVIKLCLNAHSTLLMGRLGRYEGNLMTFVRPSNYKLIDRACRYARVLLQNHGIQDIDDQKLVRLCFEVKENSGPVVLNLVRLYLDRF